MAPPARVRDHVLRIGWNLVEDEPGEQMLNLGHTQQGKSSTIRPLYWPAVYQDAGVVRSGLGFVYLSAMFALTMSIEKIQDRETALVFHIAIIAFLLMLLTLLIELTARVRMYFTPATIVVYPLILKNLKSPVSKTVFTSLLLAFVSYKFVTFFSSDTWRDYFGTYHTIFSAEQWN